GSCVACFACRLSRIIPFFFSSRRRHTRFSRDWSSDVCSSDLGVLSSIVDNVPLVAGAMGMYPVLSPEVVQASANPEYMRFFVQEIGRASCRERMWLSV